MRSVSTPNPRSPASASPESLSRIRLKATCMLNSSIREPGQHRKPALSVQALSDDQGDVVVLFPAVEIVDLVYYCREQFLGWQLCMLLQGFDQAVFAEFLSCCVERFCDAVGV